MKSTEMTDKQTVQNLNKEFSGENSALVSVIVPVYNVENYLERCLATIINQTYHNIEIICVDDGSTDRSGEILDKYSKMDFRITVIHKENGGVSSARNAAFPYVKGKYIYFVDPDDYIENHAVEKCVTHMTDDVDIVVHGAQVECEGSFDANDPNDPNLLQRLKESCAVKIDGKYPIDDENIGKITVTVWAKLLRHEILQKKELTFLEGYRFEDNAFTTEYLYHAKHCYFLSDNLYHYVQRPNSIVHNDEKDVYKDNLYIFDHLYKRLKSFCLLEHHKNHLTNLYSALLSYAWTRATSDERRVRVKQVASELAQNYDSHYFMDDTVYRVKEREFGLLPVFDQEVIIVLLLISNDVESACTTIRSLFAQSYKLPKILLYAKMKSVVEEDYLVNGLTKHDLTKYIEKNIFIEWNENLSIFDKVDEFADQIIITAECGSVYSKHWLRSVMTAYTEHKDVLKSCHFENIKDITCDTLFLGFSVLDLAKTGQVTIYKSKEIIASIASCPDRIQSAVLAINSIYKQTKLPDRVILWLASEDFPGKLKDLPEELLQFVKENNLLIRWCEDNIKLHNKYFWAFREYPDALVITFDDSILYPPQSIENLLLSWLCFPYAVSAGVSYVFATSENGKILSYNLWPKFVDAYVAKPSMQYFALSVGGVLYPTNLFQQVKELFDKEAIKHCCLYNDDLWLKAMELVADIPVVLTEQYIDLQNTQVRKIDLWEDNRIDRELSLVQKEIDIRYGEGYFCQKLIQPVSGVNLTRKESLYELVEYYRDKTERIQGLLNEEISRLNEEISRLNEEISRLNEEVASFQNELTAIKESRGHRVLRKYYFVRDTIRKYLKVF